MRIIHQAMVLPEENISCPSCKSELAYDKRDIRIYDDEWFRELYIVCPVCGKRIVLKHISEGC